MKTPNRIPSETLEQAFVTLMDRAGKRVIKDNMRSVGQLGPLPQVFQMPDGGTARLRTNNKRVVLAKVATGDIEARLPFESEDFLGIAIPAERPNAVVGYLVPSKVAARAMRDGHQEWLKDSSHSRENKHRALNFDGNEGSASYGYAKKWSEYCLGEISFDDMPAARALDQVIAEARRKIASSAGRPESAVMITIAY